MIRCSVTISLVPEARGGPFVFWDDLDASMAAAADLGFDGVEIFASHPDDLHGLELRDLLRKHNLKLAAMGTGAGWVQRKLTLTDPDPRQRLCAQDFVGAVIDFAGGYGAPAIIGSMQGRVPPGGDRQECLAWLAEALGQLGPRAHALDVPLFFEPLNRYETNLMNTLDATCDFLGQVNSRNIRILADLFHMNIEEACLPSALRRAGPLVGHVHFADSNRRAIGFGHLDVAPIVDALRQIGYDGWISAEILPLPDGLAAARKTMESFRRCFR